MGHPLDRPLEPVTDWPWLETTDGRYHPPETIEEATDFLIQDGRMTIKAAEQANTDYHRVFDS